MSFHSDRNRSHYKSLRGDFLEYRAISAQKYRHPLRESEAFCCCQNGGVENSYTGSCRQESSGHHKYVTG